MSGNDIQGLKAVNELLARIRVLEPAMEEASSILLSVKINYEKRGDALTMVERELLLTIREWLTAHPPPGGDV